VSSSVTIYDVAREAGVSISTVSRSLRNNPNVRPDLRARVQTVADRLGYRPHPLVAALMAQIRTHRKLVFQGNLAYLDWCARREDFATQPVLRRFHAGAVRAAEAQGYALEQFFPAADGLSRATLMRMLAARGMRGAVVFVHVPQDPVTRDALSARTDTTALPLDFSRLTSAALGGRFAPASPHFAANDQYAAGRLVGEQLLARGYRRPGLALSNYLDVVTEQRFHAGLHSVWSRREGVDPLRCLVHREGDAGTLVSWVRAERPDVLVSYTNDALAWLRAAGLRAPRDLGFCSLDVELGGAVAGVDQRHEEVGAAAVSLVIDQLNQDRLGLPEIPRGLLVEGCWVEGRTLRALARRRAAQA
jgi:DNA-binding LacI/PurR family transcriptional regulator